MTKEDKVGVVEKAINTYGRIMSLLAILGALAVRAAVASRQPVVQWPQAGCCESQAPPLHTTLNCCRALPCTTVCTSGRL
jgi:hypothetical protein